VNAAEQCRRDLERRRGEEVEVDAEQPFGACRAIASQTQAPTSPPWAT
jgi:hypothetical protein